MTPFRGEKATGWEGGFRVPCVIRRPGHIKPGQVNNDIVSAEDWMPTLLAAAGLPDINENYWADILQERKILKCMSTVTTNSFLNRSNDPGPA